MLCTDHSVALAGPWENTERRRFAPNHHPSYLDEQEHVEMVLG